MGWMSVKFAGRCGCCGRSVPAGERADWQRGRGLAACNACNGKSPSETTPAPMGVDVAGATRGASDASTAAPSITPSEAAANLAAAIARLDPDQAKTVCWTPAAGNLRVVAAAGSGKTTTIVTLLGRLVRDGQVPAAGIIATTFTAKAGKELGERLSKVIDPGLFASLRVGTFHSLAIRALRNARHPIIGDFSRCLDGSRRAAGIPNGTLLWTQILGFGPVRGTSFEGIDVGDADPKAYAMAADLIRSRTFEPGSTEARAAAREFEAAGLTRFPEAWDRFAEAKRQLGAWDFADALAAYRAGLMAGTVRDGAAVVVVDEAQDNSCVQLDLAVLLARQGRLIVVGDVRQSIYEWRGAFPKLFATADTAIGAATEQIRQNYRSGRKIVAVANRIADGKPWAIGDAQNAARDTDGTVRVTGHADTRDEADVIADEIQNAIDADGARPDAYAILGRTNASLATVEAALVKARIPCAVVGGTSFFDRRDVRDALAYLTLAQSDDVEAFERIVNRPKRFLGKAYVAAVKGQLARGGSIADAVEATIPALNRRQVDGAADLLAILRKLRRMTWSPEAATGEHPADLVAALFAALAPKSEVGDDDKPGLVATVAEIARTFESAVALLRFADQCAAAVTTVSEGEHAAGRVTLSTIHRAKGLEWANVTVLATEGTFPHHRTKGDPAREAEEERLFYVACTRARDVLTISWAEKGATRSAGGPSSFIGAYVEPELTPDPETPGPGGSGPRGGEPVQADEGAAQAEASPEPAAPSPGATRSEATEGLSFVASNGVEVRTRVEVFPLAASAPVRPAVRTIADDLAEIDAAMPAAQAHAAVLAAAAPVSTDGGRFVPVTRSEFSALLAPLGFAEGTGKGQRVWARQIGPVDVRVYSTIPSNADTVRDVGEDSIKVALMLRSPERPLAKRLPYACRTRGWRVTLLDRIDEVLGTLRDCPSCVQCGAPTVRHRLPSGDGKPWFACVQWCTRKEAER